jgi:hypothetical protein
LFTGLPQRARPHILRRLFLAKIQKEPRLIFQNAIDEILDPKTEYLYHH